MGARRSKPQAIRTALGRLGWHTHPEEVVTFLAAHGIEVSAGLVQKVKREAARDRGGLQRKLTLVRPKDRSDAVDHIRRLSSRRRGR
jgi:hypothetical protein